MIRAILKYPNVHLTSMSAPVIPEDDAAEIAELIKDLIDTVKAPHDKVKAVGLSAPQIGTNKRVVVINYDKFPEFIMINPKIVEATGRMKHDEMCLSFPKMFRRKTRKQFIKVDFLDKFWNPKTQVFTGMDAFIVQHELDHLDGRTILDE